MSYRQRANAILGLSFLCFIAIFCYWYTHEVSFWENLILFVVQSALIGSIADWFAVTALFDKPLGFPYHTELVYRNRSQIIDAITRTVSEKLLQANMWREKLYDISFVNKAIDWLRSPDGREKFRSVLYEVAWRTYEYAQRGSTQEYIADHVRQYLKRQPLADFFQDRLIALLEDPDSKVFNDAIHLGRKVVDSDDFDALLDKLIKQWVDESQDAKVSSKALNKFVSIIDTRKLSKDIKKGIIAWLDKLEHAEGEERAWLCHRLELFLYSMNGQLAYSVQKWQEQFVDDLPVEQWLNATQRAAKAYFTQGEKGKEELKDLLEEQFLHYLEYCSSHPEIKDWLDEQIRRACNVILEHEHSLIAVAVRDVLTGFDKKKFNEFLESKVGEDLAWIRINGAIVGGSIGFVVFAFLQFIYEPLFVPFIRGLFL